MEEYVTLGLRRLTKYDRSGDAQNGSQGNPQETQDELMNLMTIVYIAVQEALNDPEDMASSYGKLRTLALLPCLACNRAYIFQWS